MKNPEDAASEKDTHVLRNKIRHRYSQYHQRNPGRFPSLDLNTNRANYEPLREAFEEEFYVARRLERNTPTLHIPSTNTLMLLFTEPAYVPGRKILNTCWSFADGPTTVVPQPPAPPVRPVPELRSIGTAAAIALSLLALIWVTWWLTRPQPSGLFIDRPATNSVVPREMIVGGHVTNAQTVWIVVRSVANQMCWVQPPICVQHDNYWVGVMYIGSRTDSDSVYSFDVRAFVKPKNQLKAGDVLRDWPEAQLSTPAISVVRRPVDKRD